MVDKCSECTVTISCLNTFKKYTTTNQTKTKRIIKDRMPYFTAATSNRQKLDGCSKPIYQYLTVAILLPRFPLDSGCNFCYSILC